MVSLDMGARIYGEFADPFPTFRIICILVAFSAAFSLKNKYIIINRKFRFKRFILPILFTVFYVKFTL